MTTALSHRALIVWQKAMDLVVEVYRLCERFPQSKAWRLTNQVTRAAASVPANIAEGNARGSKRDYAQFVAIARGSLMETETFLMLANRLKYLAEAETVLALDLIAQIDKMLSVLRKRLLA